MKLRASLLVFAMAVVGYSLMAEPASAAHASKGTTGGITGLTACIAQQHRLDVNVMMDESGSLSESVNGQRGTPTDPDNDRVPALQDLLGELSGLSAGNAPVRVNVALQGFSSDVETVRPFAALNPATLGNVTRSAGEFTSKDRGLDTDFYSAVSAARTALAEQSAASGGKSCQAFVLFTDGVFSFEVQPSVTRSYAPGLSASTPSGANALAAAGERALCAPNGPVDALRADGVFAIAIGLGPAADQGRTLLRGISEHGCGTRPSPGGGFFPASDFGQLLQVFAEVSSAIGGGHPQGIREGLPRSFELGADLSKVNITTQSPNLPHGMSVLLTGPGGAHMSFGPIGRGVLDGLTWSSRESRDGLVDLVGRPASSQGTWAGEWTVATHQTAGKLATTDVSVTPDLVPRLAAPPSLTIGQRSTVTIQLQRMGGAAPDAAELLEKHDASVSLVSGGGSPIRIPVRAGVGGVFTGVYKPSVSNAASSVRVNVNLVGVGADGTTVSDVARTFSLAVNPPRAFPIPPSQVDFGTVTETNSASAHLLVTGGRESGCVAVGGLIPDGVPPGVHAERVTGPTTCVPVTAGARVSLPLTLTHVGKGSGQLTGLLAVALHDSKGHLITQKVPVVAAFSDPVKQTRRILIFVALIAGGIIFPIILLYLLAFILGRFRPLGSLRYATVEARASSLGVAFPDDNVGPGDLVESTFPVPESGRGAWRISVPDAPVLRSRLSRNPFVSPTARADGGGAGTVASGGTIQVRGRWIGIMPTQLGASWVFVVDSVGNSQIGEPEAVGHLTILTAETRISQDAQTDALEHARTNLGDLVAPIIGKSDAPSEPAGSTAQSDDAAGVADVPDLDGLDTTASSLPDVPDLDDLDPFA